MHRAVKRAEKPAVTKISDSRINAAAAAAPALSEEITSPMSGSSENIFTGG